MRNLRNHVVKAEIRIGVGVVSVRRKGSSEACTARVLAVDVAEDGRTVCVFLDRLLHGVHEHAIGSDDEPWDLGGAYVTTMTRFLRDEEIRLLRGEDLSLEMSPPRLVEILARKPWDEPGTSERQE